MEGEVVKKNRITEGSIFGQLLLFFFPILFGTFFQQLYNTADAMVVGRFVGKQALAAVGGSTSTLINLLVGFFVGLSSGATVVISQFYGARKADKVHWAVHTSIAFSIIGGIAFMIIGLAGSPWALEAMKTPEDVMGHSVVYIRIYFLGIIVNLIYNMGAGILRAVGDSRRPLYFLIASCFTNIALDILLVAVLGMGVAGAAIATISSQLLSAILVVRALMKTDDTVSYTHLCQPRDSSAAAVAVCGIHEMLKYLPEVHPDKETYQYAMHRILRSLMEGYANPDIKEGAPVLLHGVYSWHSGKGVDEGNIWGDYYYMEALMRFYKDWNLYW